jgi:hypothetical protein
MKTFNKEGFHMPRRWLFRFLILTVTVTFGSARGDPAASGEAERIAIGKRIFLEGIGGDGQPVRAVAGGDVPVEGAQAACVGCHRRSGFGSSEGNVVVPPITHDLLYVPRDRLIRQSYAPGSTGSGLRPAYTEATLRRAIVAGNDPAGRTLGPSMPRYVLDDRAAGALLAYLGTLRYVPALGVTDTEIHFATIVAGEVEPDRRRALLDVLNGYVQVKNAGARYEEKRAKFPPWHMQNMYRAFRKWRLDVWELRGGPAEWPRQLEEAYRRQPVFAVLNGIGEGTWQPVHDFCESQGVPCLFPTIDMPPAEADSAFYPLYFSAGLRLEAEALAKYVDERNPGQPIVQVFTEEYAGSTAAAAFRQALERRRNAALLRDIKFPSDTKARHEASKAIAAQRAPILVLWLNERDLSAIASLELPFAERIVLSRSLWDGSETRSLRKLADRVEVLHPLALPSLQASAIQSMEPWLRSRHIPPGHPRIQANAYFAVLAANDAVTHLTGYFSREYFIETIEHTLEKMPFQSLYPRLSLGADQRYAAKGCYLMPLRALRQPTDSGSGTWIIP